MEKAYAPQATIKYGHAVNPILFIREHCAGTDSVSTVGGLSAGLSRLDFVINTTEHKGKHKEKENI